MPGIHTPGSGQSSDVLRVHYRYAKCADERGSML